MYGGALMVAVGVFYLAFERKLLAKSRMSGDSTAPADNLFSRSLIGAQVREPYALLSFIY
jgi:phosphatidylinositol glycan class N